MNIHIQEISFDMAAPAGRLDIIKHLLSNGRYGKLFVSKVRDYKRFTAPPQHINCRSVTRTMIVKLDATPKRVPFDLDRALAGDALVTRNGGDASGFKVNIHGPFPYSAMTHIFEHDFLEDGSFLPSLQHPLDLFMKHELNSNKGVMLADGSFSGEYIAGDTITDKGYGPHEITLTQYDVENKKLGWWRMTPTKGTLRKVAKRKVLGGCNE